MRMGAAKKLLAALSCPGALLAAVFISWYDSMMTQAVAHILEKVRQLSPNERAELGRAIVEHIPMSGDLTEDDYAALAAASFRALDEEEAAQGA